MSVTQMFERSYRLLVVVFLAFLSLTQVMILRSIPPSQNELRRATGGDRRRLEERIPMVKVEGSVEVSGSVEVDNTVIVELNSEPIEVEVIP